MIPRDFITAWRAHAPWVQDFQVEQDLIISRALVMLYSHPLLAKGLAFRGGTALYKLHLKPAARYSEDIDLVQVDARPAGPMMAAVREVFDPWLGKPQWKQGEGGITFLYRFASEDTPPVRLRLKIEINSREHFTVYGLVKSVFDVDSRWFSGSADVVTYELDELLATKLRALFQRKKGRDLFDLALALEAGKADPRRVIAAFSAYMEHGGHQVTRALFEQNLAGKLGDRQFAADIGPLLAAGHTWDIARAAQAVSSRLIRHLPGDPWKGTEKPSS